MNLEPTALNYLLEISFYLIKVDLKTIYFIFLHKINIL